MAIARFPSNVATEQHQYWIGFDQTTWDFIVFKDDEPVGMLPFDQACALRDEVLRTAGRTAEGKKGDQT